VREWSEVNLALAVAVENGLAVPVIRRADASSLGDLMRARIDLVERARAGKLRAGDVAGGTFTLSNLGGFGIDFFSSILNAGQAGILSVGALRDKPAVVTGELVIRPIMTLGLTIDHRVSDGAGGAQFLAALKTRIEQLKVDE
jgi:pyruvate dehydrogenase E2 component (dihydrolipoamide acetyltransferase)